jgi:hypothetical protein
VNFCGSCIVTTSASCCFPGSFSGSEFPTERFMVTCAREALINEWDA